MRDFLAERDPSRNSQFQRRWVDDPLRLSDFQHLGREVAPQVVEDAGRRAIGCWLDKASGTHGAVAAKAFRQADDIRQRLWERSEGTLVCYETAYTMIATGIDDPTELQRAVSGVPPFHYESHATLASLMLRNGHTELGRLEFERQLSHRPCPVWIPLIYGILSLSE